MSKTHGPRMNRARTREVVDNLGLIVVMSNGHGIEIRRGSEADGSLERWRLYTGGGIAGNSDQVWLRPITRTGHPARGPYWNKTQLAAALRTWRRGA